jgi:hypothetical protein
MRVTALVTGHGIDVHAVRCQDLKRGENRLLAVWADKFDSMDDLMDEYLDTGDENAPGWQPSEFRFLPCTAFTGWPA